MIYDCLIIDDEKELADNTCEYFNMFDVHSKAVYSSLEAMRFFEHDDARLLLLDINLSTDGGTFLMSENLALKTSLRRIFGVKNTQTVFSSKTCGKNIKYMV